LSVLQLGHYVLVVKHNNCVLFSLSSCLICHILRIKFVVVWQLMVILIVVDPNLSYPSYQVHAVLSQQLKFTLLALQEHQVQVVPLLPCLPGGHEARQPVDVHGRQRHRGYGYLDWENIRRLFMYINMLPLVVLHVVDLDI
jgi:hypothetical protein